MWMDAPERIAGPGPLRITMPAAADELGPMRRTVARWARSAGLGESLSTDLQLAVGEAVANGVEHAYRDASPGTVEIALELQDDAVAARVSDRGHWRRPPALPGYRGRGLAMIRALARDVRIRPGVRGTVVTFELAVGHTVS